MKKIIFLFVIVFFAFNANAQNVILPDGKNLPVIFDSAQTGNILPSVSATTQGNVYSFENIPIKDEKITMGVKFYNKEGNFNLIWVCLNISGKTIPTYELQKDPLFIEMFSKLFKKVQDLNNNWTVEENYKTIQEAGKLPDKYKTKY